VLVLLALATRMTPSKITKAIRMTDRLRSRFWEAFARLALDDKGDLLVDFGLDFFAIYLNVAHMWLE